MSKNDIVINKYNINHRSACRLFRVNSYNNGIYPFVPKRYKYLYLAVGYNKVRPTAIVEVKTISFKPAAVRGNRAKWIVEYHLGKVVEVNIPK